jgi:PAS domain-containing protein
LVNRDLQYVRINERLAAINGHPVGDHLGRTIQEMVPGIARMVVPIYRHVIETGEPVIDLEICGCPATAPNATRNWLASYHALKNADGSVYGVCGVVIDITERKQAEEARRKSEAEFRVTFENAAFGIALVDLEGHPIHSNRAL